jgi:hypothetical protein
MKKVTTVLCVLLLSISAVSAQGLVGTKTIGGSNSDFSTLQAAVNALSAQGVGAGGVTFVIRSGVYNEGDSLTITNVQGSAQNPVVFRADTNATIVINFNIRNLLWGIRFQNSDYITFDGSSANGDTTKRITLNGRRLNESDEFFTTYISNGSDFCTLKNLIITHENNTAQTGFSLPVYWSTFQVSTPEAGMNALQLLNCTVIGGNTFGVYLDGDPEKTITNSVIKGNTIYDFARFGIVLNADVNGVVIDGNEIFQTRRGRSAVYGINIEGATCINTTIANNFIRDLRADSLAGIFGIFLGSGSLGNFVYNNCIYLIPQPTANTSYGIYSLLSNNAGNRFYHNSVFLGGTSTRNVSSYAFRTTADFSNDTLINNIFINARTGGTANHFAMRWKTLSIAVSNNNFLSVLSDSVGDNRFVAQIDALLCNTLADLLVVPNYLPRDSASLSGNPLWQLPSLALQENSPAINRGRLVPFIPTDFFGNPRVGNHDIGAIEFQPTTTSPNRSQEKTTFELAQNYPNPFNPETRITYQLSTTGEVKLELFDMLGRKVATLFSSRQAAGTYSFTLNAMQFSLASGLYFYRLQVNGTAQTKKMVLLK